jgi:hypothetical protein
LLVAPTIADGWRGVGAVLAVAWFLAPVSAQARVVSFIGRLGRVPSADARPRRAGASGTFLSPESAVHE